MKSPWSTVNAPPDVDTAFRVHVLGSSIDRWYMIGGPVAFDGVPLLMSKVSASTTCCQATQPISAQHQQAGLLASDV